MSAKKIKIALLSLVLVASQLAVMQPVSAHPKGLLFPLIGAGTFSNDFNSARSDGPHNATDIIAPKGTKIVAAVAGTVTYMPLSQPSWGYMVTVKDADGFKYDYIHINNDNPGTDDGLGGPFYAYAPDVGVGRQVERGQFIGYVGDSGNAENTVSHLHFEITAPDGSKVNPYPYLLEAEHSSAPATYPARGSEMLPYGPTIQTLPSIDVGSFSSGNGKQIVIGTGVGYAPHVRVLEQNGDELAGFYAYKPDFTGGINVAAGDVDGDGIDEIITGTVTGAPHVRALKTDGREVASFYAYSPTFDGGVYVAAADVDGDGKDEIITGPGPGGAPHVRVLKADGTQVAGFYAYDSTFTGGIDVAGGDVTGDTKAEIVTAPGPGGSPHIRVFSGNGTAVGEGFNAYQGFTGGARVSVGNVRTSTAKSEIVTSPWGFGSPHMRMFTATGQVLDESQYFDSWWNGRYDVAAGDGVSYITTGYNRRSSLLKALQ